MQISERELRSLVQEVDDLNREGMASMADDIKTLHAETRGFRRRTLLKRAAVGGAALTVGGTVLPIGRLLPAGAQGLTDGDIAAFAESVELAAVAAYQMAGASGLLPKPVLDAALKFAGHHQAHAEAFGGAAGAGASKKPNAALLTALGPQLQAANTVAKIGEFALDLENAAAATYLFALGALTSTAALQLTASILPVESQHAVVWGIILGRTGKALFPDAGNAFETETAALNPAMFPVR